MSGVAIRRFGYYAQFDRMSLLVLGDGVPRDDKGIVHGSIGS